MQLGPRYSATHHDHHGGTPLCMLVRPPEVYTPQATELHSWHAVLSDAMHMHMCPAVTLALLLLRCYLTCRAEFPVMLVPGPNTSVALQALTMHANTGYQGSSCL